MNKKGIVVLGAVLLMAGLAGLAYGGITYTSDVHDADLGPIEFKVEEKDRIEIPMWAAAGSAVVGGLLIGFGARTSKLG